jgi:dipeptidase
LLEKRAGKIGVADMMTMLRDHGDAADARKPGEFGPTLCVHPGTGITAASMVAHLHRDGVIAWCSLVTPCIGVFLPFFVDASVPESLAQGAATFSAESPWWRVKRLLNRAAEDWGKSFPPLREHWQEWQQTLLREAADHRKDSSDHKSMWVNRNVAKWLTELAALEKSFGLER